MDTISDGASVFACYHPKGEGDMHTMIGSVVDERCWWVGVVMYVLELGGGGDLTSMHVEKKPI